jgi:hypothetical protein
MPLRLTAQEYTAGVAVCDTIGPNFPYFADCPDGFLEFRVDSLFIPYVTGLTFQVEILATDGIVLSNIADTVRAGDTFSLPASNESGLLRISFVQTGASFTFITKVVGTPEIPGETYSCDLTTATTTALCHNWFDIANFGNDSTCTVKSPPSSVDFPSEIPDKYSLKQNYPNPFNPSTNILYSIPNANFVTLKIYDILGNEVRTLVNEFQQPDIYSIRFDAKTLASGIYFFRLQVGSKFRKTIKMLLLR